MLRQAIRQWKLARVMSRTDSLFETKGYAQALREIDSALLVHPNNAELHFRRATACLGLQQLHDALASLDKCLALAPRHSRAWGSKGSVLLQLGHAEAALNSLVEALRLDASLSDAAYNRGLALRRLHRLPEARAIFEELAHVSPLDTDVLNNLGTVLAELRQVDQALATFDKALSIRPDVPEVLLNKAQAETDLRRPEAAALSLARLLEIRPDYPLAKGLLLQAKLQACDWTALDEWIANIDQDILAGIRSIEPFPYQAYARDPALQLRCARLNTEPAVQRPHQTRARKRADAKVCVAYVSGEFRQQATSTLLISVLENHDRDRFDVLALDNGWDDGSSLRRRIVSSVDRLLPIGHLDDNAVARLVEEYGVDILVDLNGFFGFARPGLFAHHPAPIQVNYLGFPGTLGSNVHDYIIADRIVIPESEQAHYSERVTYLSGSYQPNSPDRACMDGGLRRADARISEDAFVFCCLNNNYKIMPAVFSVWMRLLRQVPDSILWLLKDNEAAEKNLREQASRHGIGLDRIVFSERASHEIHLARLSLADLFLDTTPCNAHTTASDALRAGLPVLTCTDRTFSSRVAASLLYACELDGLVTSDLQAYEARALNLATDRGELARLKHHLDTNRERLTLFNARLYTRELEAAYVAMLQGQHIVRDITGMSLDY